LKLSSSINWVITWLALALLKRSIRNRLKGEGADWLQPVLTNDPGIFNRVDFIIEHSANKKVLHIGFSDHPYTVDRILSGDLLHIKLKKIATGLVGVDNEPVAIQQYTSLTMDMNVFHTDITVQYPIEVIQFNPELVLLSEVLEHLTDPYKAIEVLHNSFADGTMIMVTVPNYVSLDSLASSTNKSESIHPHHHWYFSPYTLCQLLDSKRFKLLQLHFGMYYQQGTKINAVLKSYPFNGDCIIALFSIIKKDVHD
jgi:hypothetical protein